MLGRISSQFRNNRHICRLESSQFRKSVFCNYEEKKRLLLYDLIIYSGKVSLFGSSFIKVEVILTENCMKKPTVILCSIFWTSLDYRFIVQAKVTYHNRQVVETFTDCTGLYFANVQSINEIVFHRTTLMTWVNVGMSQAIWKMVLFYFLKLCLTFQQLVNRMPPAGFSTEKVTSY